jgi:hypothetical protein
MQKILVFASILLLINVFAFSGQSSDVANSEASYRLSSLRSATQLVGQIQALIVKS